MKKLIIFFLFSISAFAQQQEWYWQNPYPQGNDLRDVYFINSIIGWAIGAYGTVIKTTDGGKNWTVKMLDPVVSLNGIRFIDENIGFISCGYGKLYVTSDGGNDWNLEQTVTNQNLGKIFFIDN